MISRFTAHQRLLSVAEADDDLCFVEPPRPLEFKFRCFAISPIKSPGVVIRPSEDSCVLFRDLVEDPVL